MRAKYILPLGPLIRQPLSLLVLLMGLSGYGIHVLSPPPSKKSSLLPLLLIQCHQALPEKCLAVTGISILHNC